MRDTRHVAAIILLFVMSMGGAAALAQAAPPPERVQSARGENPAGGEVVCAGNNLLTNASFEGPYSSYVPPNGHPDCPAGVCQTAQMADGWSPWWRSHNPADPDYIIVMPEYKPAESVFVNPPRVRTGDRAQQLFTFFRTHEAGIFQQAAVTPGRQYCFSMWGHSWSAQDDDDAYSGPEDGILVQKVGVDPNGATDWQSGSILWTPARTQYDFYGGFMIEAVALTDTMTVFGYSQPAYAVKHNDVYWDDAVLVEVGIDVPGGHAFLHETANRREEAITFVLNMGGRSDLVWSVNADPGGTLPLTLNQTSGAAGDDLTITVDSRGMADGTYETELTLSTNHDLPGTPAVFPILLVVAPAFEKGYVPLAFSPVD